MIKLDGSYGEGGGALVRVALALSTLTGKAFEVDNIRAGKPDGGGLKPQHLTAINTLKEICDAKTNEISLIILCRRLCSSYPITSHRILLSSNSRTINQPYLMVSCFSSS